MTLWSNCYQCISVYNIQFVLQLKLIVTDEQALKWNWRGIVAEEEFYENCITAAWLFELTCDAHTAREINGVPAMSGDGSVRSFFALLRTSERAICCSSEVRLYVLTPSTLRWPVHSITSCSSTPDAYSRVALVTLSEWLVLYRWIPAALHRRPTVWASLLCPSGCLEYQYVGVGLLKGVR